MDAPVAKEEEAVARNGNGRSPGDRRSPKAGPGDGLRVRQDP